MYFITTSVAGYGCICRLLFLLDQACVQSAHQKAEHEEINLNKILTSLMAVCDKQEYLEVKYENLKAPVVCQGGAHHFHP